MQWHCAIGLLLVGTHAHFWAHRRKDKAREREKYTQREREGESKQVNMAVRAWPPVLFHKLIQGYFHFGFRNKCASSALVLDSISESEIPTNGWLNDRQYLMLNDTLCGATSNRNRMLARRVYECARMRVPRLNEGTAGVCSEKACRRRTWTLKRGSMKNLNNWLIQPHRHTCQPIHSGGRRQDTDIHPPFWLTEIIRPENSVDFEIAGQPFGTINNPA